MGKAARGADGWLYPWGNDFDPQKCNMEDTGIGTTSAVGLFPAGASPYGVEEMSGNVDEWCMTVWQGDYHEYKADLNTGGHDTARVLRGGSWFSSFRNARCAYRHRYSPVNRDYGLGFRVAVSLA